MGATGYPRFPPNFLRARKSTNLNEPPSAQAFHNSCAIIGKPGDMPIDRLPVREVKTAFRPVPAAKDSYRRTCAE